MFTRLFPHIVGKQNDYQSHMGHTGNLIITIWTIVFGKGSSNDPFHGSNLFHYICILYFTLIIAVTSSLCSNSKKEAQYKLELVATGLQAQYLQNNHNNLSI